jgi:hypothetical protein
MKGKLAKAVFNFLVWRKSIEFEIQVNPIIGEKGETIKGKVYYLDTIGYTFIIQSPYNDKKQLRIAVEWCAVYDGTEEGSGTIEEGWIYKYYTDKGIREDEQKFKSEKEFYAIIGDYWKWLMDKN